MPLLMDWYPVYDMATNIFKVHRIYKRMMYFHLNNKKKVLNISS